MPKEYIERDAAIEAIMSEPPDAHYPSWYIDRIKTLSAADVAPVVHGRWVFGKDLPDSFGSINKNKYHLYCSECRNQAFNNSTDNDCDFDMDTPFCPWCGTKMDGDVDNG